VLPKRYAIVKRSCRPTGCRSKLGDPLWRSVPDAGAMPAE